MDLSNMKNKCKGDEEGFEESPLTSLDPIKQFGNWLDEATKCPEIGEANAMCIATATKDGRPSARMVLLKDYNNEGFRFFSIYESRKGIELESNPYAGLVFHWEPLNRQIRIEGNVEKIPYQASCDEFHSRPKNIQISSIVSRQGTVLPDRFYLRQKYVELLEKFKDTEVPMPDFWGGYIVKPFLFEFWQGQPNRLNERIVFTKLNPGEELEEFQHMAEGDWYLRQKYVELLEKFKDTEVPMPDFWGGYIVKYFLFEFWQGQRNRLDERIVFTKLKPGEELGEFQHMAEGDWVYQRLSP